MLFQISKVGYYEKNELYKKIANSWTYLRGHVFRSSSVDFSIRSTDDWLLDGDKGDGSSSNDQNLFLANPCCSSEPMFPNCTVNDTLESKILKISRAKKVIFGISVRYLRKADRYPSPDSLRWFPKSLQNEQRQPRIHWGGLLIKTGLFRNVEEALEVKTSLKKHLLNMFHLESFQVFLTYNKSLTLTFFIANKALPKARRISKSTPFSRIARVLRSWKKYSLEHRYHYVTW